MLVVWQPRGPDEPPMRFVASDAFYSRLTHAHGRPGIARYGGQAGGAFHVPGCTEPSRHHPPARHAQAGVADSVSRRQVQFGNDVFG